MPDKNSVRSPETERRPQRGVLCGRPPAAASEAATETEKIRSREMFLFCWTHLCLVFRSSVVDLWRAAELGLHPQLWFWSAESTEEGERKTNPGVVPVLVLGPGLGL